MKKIHSIIGLVYLVSYLINLHGDNAICVEYLQEIDETVHVQYILSQQNAAQFWTLTLVISFGPECWPAVHISAIYLPAQSVGFYWNGNVLWALPREHLSNQSRI